MLKSILLFSVSLILLYSCVKDNTIINPDKVNFTGRWEVKFYLNNVEQEASEPYFWTFGADSSFVSSNSFITSQNSLISWKLNAKKYKIIPFETYKNLSLDYEYMLNSFGITENDCIYFFDLGYHELKYIYSGKNAYQILGLPLGVKQLETNSIILIPVVANRFFEIRLTKK